MSGYSLPLPPPLSPPPLIDTWANVHAGFYVWLNRGTAHPCRASDQPAQRSRGQQAGGGLRRRYRVQPQELFLLDQVVSARPLPWLPLLLCWLHRRRLRAADRDRPRHCKSTTRLVWWLPSLGRLGLGGLVAGWLGGWVPGWVAGWLACWLALTAYTCNPFPMSCNDLAELPNTISSSLAAGPVCGIMVGGR